AVPALPGCRPWPFRVLQSVFGDRVEHAIDDTRQRHALLARGAGRCTVRGPVARGSRGAQPFQRRPVARPLVHAEAPRALRAARVGAAELRLEAAAAAMQDDVESGVAQALGGAERRLERGVAVMHDVNVAAGGGRALLLLAQQIEHALDAERESAGRRILA